MQNDRGPRRTPTWPLVRAWADRFLGRPLRPAEHVRTVLKEPPKPQQSRKASGSA